MTTLLPLCPHTHTNYPHFVHILRLVCSIKVVASKNGTSDCFNVVYLWNQWCFFSLSKINVNCCIMVKASSEWGRHYGYCSLSIVNTSCLYTHTASWPMASRPHPMTESCCGFMLLFYLLLPHAYGKKHFSHQLSRHWGGVAKNKCKCSMCTYRGERDKENKQVMKMGGSLWCHLLGGCGGHF